MKKVKKRSEIAKPYQGWIYHHHLLFALFTQYKNLFTTVIASRWGDPGSHGAYMRDSFMFPL